MNIFSFKSIVCEANQCLCALECNFHQRFFFELQILSIFDNVLWVHYSYGLSERQEFIIYTVYIDYKLSIQMSLIFELNSESLTFFLIKTNWEVLSDFLHSKTRTKSCFMNTLCSHLSCFESKSLMVSKLR
jgi:hypothetical protein